MNYHTTLILVPRFGKPGWLKLHSNHIKELSNVTYKSIIVGDSVIANISRHYPHIWNKYFSSHKIVVIVVFLGTKMFFGELMI